MHRVCITYSRRIVIRPNEFFHTVLCLIKVFFNFITTQISSYLFSFNFSDSNTTYNALYHFQIPGNHPQFQWHCASSAGIYTQVHVVWFFILKKFFVQYHWVYNKMFNSKIYFPVYLLSKHKRRTTFFSTRPRYCWRRNWYSRWR